MSFAYPGVGNEAVLKNINLHIPEGKTTAIVGTSGSGKTTLLKVLLKFHEIQKGTIKVGGHDLGNLSHRHWRKNIGVVMQENFIFSDTIAANIAVGEENIHLEKLREAAAVAKNDVLGFMESTANHLEVLTLSKSIDTLQQEIANKNYTHIQLFFRIIS